MAHYDAVVCGAGVGGLTLAHSLGMRGHRVLLVDKQRRFHMTHKGELLQPSTLALLEQAGLFGRLAAEALPVDGLACVTEDGSELVTLDYRLLPAPYRHGMVQSYKEMLDSLVDQLGPTVEFRRGASVECLVRDADGRICGVTVSCDGVTTRESATVVVACDGHASRLREAAGITVTPHRYDHQLVGFEIDDSPPVGREMNAYLTPRGLRALFDLPDGRARLYVQVPAGSMRGVGRAGLPEWAESVLSGMPAFAEFADPWRRSLATVQVQSALRFVAPRWVEPGFALLGDAAHCVHPMVGQGMNAAIRDASVLGGALADLSAMAAAEADAALRAYEATRRPEVEFTSRMSHNVATLLTSTSRVGRALLPHLLRRNQSNVRLRTLITQNVAGLTAQPLQVRDWFAATGLFARPFRRTAAVRFEETQP